MQSSTMPVVSSSPKSAVLVQPGPAKDSRWLTLEVCREFARNKCPRLDDECRFAHPPANIEVQNGRVMCCFDSIKGRCQRTDPPCKYLHPPQHLKEQLLQNGRNNLIWRNFQMQNLASGMPQFVPTVFPFIPQPARYVIQPGLASANSLASCYGSPIPSTTTALESPSSMSTMLSTGAVLDNCTQQLQPVQATADNAEGDPAVTSSCAANGCGNHNTYWVQPPIVDTPISSTTYYSPVFYQGMNAMSGVVPMVKPQMLPDMRSGSVAIYQCGAPTYQQVALSSVPINQQQPCFRLAVPVTASAVHRY